MSGPAPDQDTAQENKGHEDEALADRAPEEESKAQASAQETAEPIDDILCGLMPQAPCVPEHSHHYRCANFGLYIGCALLVLVGVIYYFVSHPPTEQPLRSLIALLAGLAAIGWALHYCSISYCVDGDGIRVRRLFGRSISLRWSELRRWEVVRIIEPEQSTCRIIFSGEEGQPSITLSSELLELEAVENLARELQGSAPA